MTDRSGFERLAPLISEAAAVEGEADLGRVLRTLVSEVMAATGAPYVAMGVIGEHQVLSDFVYEGISKEQAERIGHLPTGHGVLGTVIRENETIILERISDHPDSVGFPEHHPPMEAFLGVPVAVGGDAFGNLYLTDKDGGFTDEDLAIVQALGRIAGAAIQTARLQGRLRHVAIIEDRNRIARDLHDSVIQDLFAVGLGLQGLSTRIEDEALARTLHGSIDTLDEAVGTLRRYVFELKDVARPSLGIDERIQTLVARMGTVYPANVTLTIDDFETRDSDDELLLVVTEALSNALRHSHAENVEIELVREGDHQVLRVSDDGIGFDPSEGRDQGMGVANMRVRARGLGGEMVIDSSAEGTLVEVRVPVSPPSDRQ
ncbi:MAG TPA: GAF domain-containing sensor histidine kinase [Acidimicrobiia bacterium]|nr:GAF domain-containing sensor histidine kinase [Acidimicrobiia bacterium]